MLMLMLMLNANANADANANAKMPRNANAANACTMLTRCLGKFKTAVGRTLKARARARGVLTVVANQRVAP
jgi:hypothetical protein